MIHFLRCGLARAGTAIFLRFLKVGWGKFYGREIGARSDRKNRDLAEELLRRKNVVFDGNGKVRNWVKIFGV